MRTYSIPGLKEFSEMPPEARIRALKAVAEYQAGKVCRGNKLHLDEYASAGWVGLSGLCESFDPTEYKDDSHFSAVCLRVSRNAIIDERRRILGRFARGKWRGLTVVDVKSIRDDLGLHMVVPEETLPDDSDTPREALERAELPNRAEALISRLNPQQARVVRLIFYQGLRHAEVAKVIGVSCARIGQVLQAALVKLRT